MKKDILLYKPVFHILLIVILGLLGYSNTFHASFHFDDKHNITNNPIIKELQFFHETSTAKEFATNLQYTALKQRYIGYLTFALNYKIHGLNVTGYHIVNITVHILSALLVYWLIMLTFKTPYFSARYTLKEPVTNSYAVFISLFSALFFVSHPIQTQSVTYIIQRLASLATLFYLLSLVMYIKARLCSQTTDNTLEGSGMGPPYKPLLYFLISIVAAILAMKTKEIAFTLPVVIILYEFMFFRGKVKKRLLYLIPPLLTMLIIPVSLIGADKPIGDIIGDVSEATRVQSFMSRGDYLFTEFRVIMTYIKLIVLPIHQNLDYNYPVYRSFFHSEVFLSFMVLLAIAGFGMYVLYRSRRSVSSERLIAFGIFWFFITLSVESSIIPIKDVIFEHRVYLPSIGLIVAISTSVFMVVENLKDRRKSIDRVVIGVLAVIVVVLTGTTYARNIIWKDEVSLWEDVVSKSPKNERGYNNLGYTYQSLGFLDKALEHYQTAIKLNPDYYMAYVNLGNTYQSSGFLDKAIKNYQTALKLNPEIPEAYNNLGVVYKSQGLIDKAIEQYQIAIKLNPNMPGPYNNLGIAYVSKRLIDKAIDYYQIAIKLKPDFSEAHYNLGNAYGSKGFIDKALEHIQTATKFNPAYFKAHAILGNIYKSQGLFEKAIEEYQIAIKLKPNIPTLYYNLGFSYQSQGLLDMAIDNYKTAIRLKPDWEMPHFNLGKIYLKKGDNEKARREFEKVLQANPQYYEARKFLNSAN